MPDTIIGQEPTYEDLVQLSTSNLLGSGAIRAFSQNATVTAEASMSRLNGVVILEILNTDTAGTGTVTLYGKFDGHRYNMRYQQHDTATQTPLCGTAITIPASSQQVFEMLAWYGIVQADIALSGFSNGQVTIKMRGMPI